MTTLIAVYTSDGLVGLCDAKCYEATQPTCECSCGGRNHGAGIQMAIDHTRHMAQQWITANAQKEGLKSFTTEIHAECQQATVLQYLDVCGQATTMVGSYFDESSFT
jgi:hypothetical protein